MEPGDYRILEKVQTAFFRIALWLEILFAGLVIVGIAVYLVQIVGFIRVIGTGGLSEYLTYLFDILIGIELIKALCMKDLDSLVEVLLFAVTRNLIIGHRSMTELLIGVLAIAVLFAIRKFLFHTGRKAAGENRKEHYCLHDENE